MQEVEGPVLRNNFDYEQLEGQTGPLVYPAGFVYVFALLRALTREGKDIFRAQMIFSTIHAVLLAIVLFGIYLKTSSTPDWALFLVVLSRRAHSIFELRLFNDGIAMLFAYASITLGMMNYWTLCCIFFSLGVSIKMNVLLMAPALAVLLVQSKGILGASLRVALCGFIQVALAAPFLAVNPIGYVRRSFDLGRVFLMKWSVNYKFLDEKTFQSPQLAGMLLVFTLIGWLIFGHFRWAKSSGGLFRLVLNAKWFDNRNLNYDHVATCMLESNLIGIVFARSIHYQFYAWYVHSLPFLIWRGSFHQRNHVFGLALSIAIEICYNVYPATPTTSLLLQTVHVILLVAAWFSPAPVPSTTLKEKI
jgi:alpha-1,3-mannosyltransferase